MKRLPTVATAIAFVALLATPALARPHDIPTATPSGDDWSSDGDRESYSGERRHRRSAHRGQRRHAGKRTGRRHAQRGERRSTPVSRRGITSYAGGGLSHSCLAGPTRALLGRIEAQFGHVKLVSTCRPGAVIAGSGRPSKHASGRAIDFNAPSGRKGEVVRWLIANHKSGGIMTYSGMRHIHIDIGPRFVSLNAGRG
jgi:hypothetical protein